MMHSIGIIVQAFGEVLLAFAVLFVHARVVREHRIDKAVERSVRKEAVMAAVSIIFIIAGVVIQLHA